MTREGREREEREGGRKGGREKGREGERGLVRRCTHIPGLSSFLRNSTVFRRS